MSLVAVIMSLLSVLAPGYATEEVYTALCDTALIEVMVPEDSLAFDAGIMPLAVTDSQWSDMMAELRNVRTGVVGISNSLGYATNGTSTLRDALGFGMSVNGTYYSPMSVQFQNWLIELRKAIVASGSGSLSEFLGVSSGTMLQASGAEVNLPGTPTSLAEIDRSGFLGLASILRPVFSDSVYSFYAPYGLHTTGSFDKAFSALVESLDLVPGFLYLGYKGIEDVGDASLPVSGLLQNGFLGLGRQIFNNQANQGFFMWEYDEAGNKKAVDWTSPSLSGILSVGFSRLSDPLADLAWVLANPADIEMKKEADENTQAAADAFVKPGGAGSPGVSDITGVAGASGALKDGLQTGVSPDVALGQLIDGNNYSFFSAEVRDSLNPFQAARERSRSVDDSDGYIDFYNPNALQDFLNGVA